MYDLRNEGIRLIVRGVGLNLRKYMLVSVVDDTTRTADNCEVNQVDSSLTMAIYRTLTTMVQREKFLEANSDYVWCLAFGQEAGNMQCWREPVDQVLWQSSVSL
jgi:hypothetical protein